MGRWERRKERTKGSIVRAAMDLIQEHGFDETTMEQIAETADVAKGTLYNYFPAKEAIVGEWTATVADGKAPDHATLRRGLIDCGFLTRSSDGASYDMDLAGPRLWQFEPAVDEADVPALLAAAREEAERRRRAYLGR